MDYRLALPPDCGLMAADFVMSWNTDPICSSQARTKLLQEQGRSYDPTLDLLVGLAVTVGTGIATNALYDLIKGIFVRHGVKKRIQIKQLDQPDGSHLLVVEIEEK